jgi:hypothetical protein
MISHCRRCDRNVDGALYTVPVYLPANESSWYLLCRDCYRDVLGQDPPDQASRRNLEAKRRAWRGD